MAGISTVPGPKIAVLYSATGGGHRSVALALKEAAEGPPHFANVMCLDILHESTLFPFSKAGNLYATIVERTPWLWKAIWWVGERRRLFQTMLQLAAPLARPARNMWTVIDPDLVVCTHPLLNHVPWRQLRASGSSSPFATVVTDWTSVSWAWLNPAVDLLFLPTDAGLDRAQASGIPTDRVRMLGLPVSRRFQHVPPDQKAQHRSAMQLDPDQPAVLLVCGSGRSGRCGDIARSVAQELAAENLGQLVVVCGANGLLHQELLASNWPIPTTILGFVHEMAGWMAASDLIICKAGPSTIAEALAVGLPLLIYDFIPGQEQGNVELAVASGAAVYRTSPDEIATAVAELLRPGNPMLAQMAKRARKLSRPSAAMDTVRALMKLLPDKQSG